MKHDNRPIGIFDSGLGGLTVVGAIRRRLPQEHLIYLGDTARVPYGSKSPETIIQFAIDDARFLTQREIKAVVIACNTVSSLAIPKLQEVWPHMPFLGVVEAGTKMALEQPGVRQVVITGTAATVNSDNYRRLIHQRDPTISVRNIACPLFVPLVEAGWADTDIARQVVRLYLAPVIERPPDVLVLGCTHYPLLKPLIRELLPESVRIVDSAEACALGVEEFLRGNCMCASGENEGRQQFFVTDMPATFFTLASSFLGEALKEVDKVTLG